MTDYEEARFAEAMAWPRRPSLWRRLLAAFIDYLVVLIALYLLVGALFLLTNGGVKGSFWLNWKLCQEGTIHDNPTLARYDWQVCRTSVLGLPVANWGVGTAPGSKPGEISSISIDLDSQGNFRPAALDLGFLELIALASYLFIMEFKSGQSIGKRLTEFIVHDEDDRHRVGLPARKAVRRQFMKFLGALPIVLTGAWYAFQTWGTPAGGVQDYSSLEIVVASAALVSVLIWPVWIAISIALGGDPIHDRFAKTTVRIQETQT